MIYKMLTKNDYKKLSKQLQMYGFESYKEFLTSNLWKEFRNVLYKAQRPKVCYSCGSDCSFFHLHHISYKALLSPTNTIWVCEKCHKKIHEKRVQSATDGTIEVMKENSMTKKKKRVESLRIIPTSKLPETLHHSLNATGLVARAREGERVEELLCEYINRKRRNKDDLMVSLFEEYKKEAWKYLRSFNN